MSTAQRPSTALDALHRALGAMMTDFAGWRMPLRYDSELRRAPRRPHHGRACSTSPHGRDRPDRPGGRVPRSTTRWSATSPRSASAAPATR